MNDQEIVIEVLTTGCYQDCPKLTVIQRREIANGQFKLENIKLCRGCLEVAYSGRRSWRKTRVD
jgi:hypothetical protein